MCDTPEVTGAPSITRVTLELGGNDAALVLDDVDVKETARKVFDGAMLNAGRNCVAVEKAYVPDALYDEFCDELAARDKECVPVGAQQAQPTYLGEECTREVRSADGARAFEQGASAVALEAVLCAAFTGMLF